MNLKLNLCDFFDVPFVLISCVLTCFAIVLTKIVPDISDKVGARFTVESTELEFWWRAVCLALLQPTFSFLVKPLICSVLCVDGNVTFLEKSYTKNVQDIEAVDLCWTDSFLMERVGIRSDSISTSGSVSLCEWQHWHRLPTGFAVLSLEIFICHLGTLLWVGVEPGGPKGLFLRVG